MNVVVVESPAKAKTINKYLGSNYTVLASYGHVRDLPSKDGSVQPDNDFAMTWEVDDRAKKRLDDIAKALKGASRLILATDPDREGEAISWHVLETLTQKKALKSQTIERVVFNAITKQAVLDAMANPRQIDGALVDAYLARRALDYLVGFTLSPVLWRKLPGARSAGRVQSVALRIVCDRELEIEKFKSEEYWTLEANFTTKAGESFLARLSKLNGERVQKFSLGHEAAAQAATKLVDAGQYKIATVDAKPGKRYPAPPFTTSTLQQEASRKLGFSATRTMQVAQKLYEGVDIGGETVGLITYMRTDGVQMADEAIKAVRATLAQRFGAKYVPQTPRVYKTKAKNAQEAHEAIRPTDPARQPNDVAKALDEDQRKLYDLIWKRTMASQMEAAELERTTIDILSADGAIGFRATGSVLTFDGFLKLYQEGRDEPAEDDDDGRLPKVSPGDPTKRMETKTAQHFTEPPPRFSEATLVKQLEELGIGRPSTYASTLAVLRDREYVRMEKGRFLPEDKGRLVTAFLESFFRRYVEYDFTADLEEKLDLVSAGQLAWKQLLADFWKDFAKAAADISELRIGQVLETINDLLAPHLFPPTADGRDPRLCPSCNVGRLSLRTGRFGAFVGCSNYPDCAYTRQFQASGEAVERDTRVLGDDPTTGLSVTVRDGRFGPYLQLGEAAKKEDKPKRASLPKGLTPSDVTLEIGLKLLALPREIGLHPESGKPITAGIGRFGPYLIHDGKYANLADPLEILDIGINRAVTVIAEGGARPGRARAEPLKELGPHPESGKPINIMKGRFGPYVSHEGIFASVPKGAELDAYTLDEAVMLLAAKGKAPKGKAARGKAAAKPTKAAPKSAKAPTKAKAAAKSPAAAPVAKAKPAAKLKPKPKAAAKVAAATKAPPAKKVAKVTPAKKPAPKKAVTKKPAPKPAAKKTSARSGR
jgi:DNA topoisomerase-1